jgi:alpha-1,3-glucosyltransferase
MRITVLVLDGLIFFTSIFVFFKRRFNMFQDSIVGTIIALALLCPPFVLIDHGHFQYNCVLIGLTVWTVIMFEMKNVVFGSFLFAIAINFK